MAFLAAYQRDVARRSGRVCEEARCGSPSLGALDTQTQRRSQWSGVSRRIKKCTAASEVAFVHFQNIPARNHVARRSVSAPRRAGAESLWYPVASCFRACRGAKNGAFGRPMGDDVFSCGASGRRSAMRFRSARRGVSGRPGYGPPGM